MSSRAVKGSKRFEEVYRIYHEVEDVGKTVKQTKRRARWTFSFGDGGEEKEVVLIHSVVSGKKIVMYDGQEIHHSDEMSRAFSHSWYDQEHVLRLDIIDFVEVGAQMAKNRGDKMYELTIDGVPFGALQTRPLQLAGRQPSNRGPVRPERTADLEDDFDPRAVSGGSTLRPKAMVAKSAPVVDLLSMEDAPVSAPALPQPASSFDPFGSMAFDARGGQQDPFFGAPVSFPPTANKVISGNGSTFRGQTVPTMTAEDLARQLSGVSFAARPQPASGASIGKSSTVDLSQLNQTSMSTSIISKAPDVDQATASLVNLSNLMDDGPPKHTTAYRPVYTDNRSLEEIKATSKPTQPAKPVFIERPAPAFAPSPGFGPPSGAMYPSGMVRPPGLSPTTAFAPQPQQWMPLRPPMAYAPTMAPGFPQHGGQPAMHTMKQGFDTFPSPPRSQAPPRPPSNDPFHGFGL